MNNKSVTSSNCDLQIQSGLFSPGGLDVISGQCNLTTKSVLLLRLHFDSAFILVVRRKVWDGEAVNK